MRWSEVAPRVWRLGPQARGWLAADPHVLRTALDALLENAVAHTEPEDRIELRSRAQGIGVVIEVADEGCGIPEDALDGSSSASAAQTPPARALTAVSGSGSRSWTRS